MDKQTLGWIFFGLGVLTSIIAPLAAIFYIVAIVFFAKSREQTGGMVGLIISIVFGILALIASLIFIMLVFVSIMGGIPSVGSGSAYYNEPVITTQDGEIDPRSDDTYWLVSADIGVDPVFSASGNHEITFTSNRDTAIKITNIRFYLSDGSLAPIMFEPFTLGIGQAKTLSASGSPDMSLIDSSVVCPNARDVYSVGVEIDYLQTIGGSEASFTFDPTQKILGTCAN